MTKEQTLRQRWWPSTKEAITTVGGEKAAMYLMVKYVRTILCAGVAVYGVYQGIGNYVQTEESVYNGTVTSFGREGILFDTWEGKFAIGGQQRSIGGEFSLDEQMDSVKTDGLVDKLNEAASSGDQVRVHGKGYLATWPWRADTTYLVDSVEPLKK